jgi:hypothetical protein
MHGCVYFVYVKKFTFFCTINSQHSVLQKRTWSCMLFILRVHSLSNILSLLCSERPLYFYPGRDAAVYACCIFGRRCALIYLLSCMLCCWFTFRCKVAPTKHTLTYSAAHFCIRAPISKLASCMRCLAFVLKDFV